LPKNRAGTGACPYKGYDPMNMVRNDNARIMAVIGFKPIVGATPCGCPKSWAGTGACPYKGYVPMNMVRNDNARIMAVIGFKPMHNIRQSHCRGNPLWLPKIMGRHRGLPLQRI